MTLEWAARIALALYIVYGIAFYAEGHRARGSAGLQALNSLTELAMLWALIWAGWWS